MDEVILLPAGDGKETRDGGRGGKPSTGSIKTELRENAVGLPGMLMQVYLRVTGREDWMRRAQLVFEQSGGGH